MGKDTFKYKWISNMSPFVHQHITIVFAEYSVCLALPAGACNTCVQSGVDPDTPYTSGEAITVCACFLGHA